MYICGIIKGEEACDAYCLRRWGERPRYWEHFAHIGDVTIERIEAKDPEDGLYSRYCLLFMPHPDGTTGDTSELRKQAYESIENGTAHFIAR